MITSSITNNIDPFRLAAAGGVIANFNAYYRSKPHFTNDSPLPMTG